MRYAWIKKTLLPSPLFLALALTACGQAMDKSANAQAMDAYEASVDAAAAANLKTGQAFLANIAKQPGVVKLPSGVMYKIISRSPNPGPQPTIDDTVTINYEGKLVDGTVFDSSYARNQPATFPLNRLVPAWQQAIPLMHVGDEIMLYVPSSQGYGERDMGEIPPNSALVFHIQLLAIPK
ncbi:FKBP-type peptidyl-prolyl cis-trans isomerase [Asticcacaulis sp. EMRT-3]|uniref:FKBP-type peptidyl-prolyl cis-trans isomerase n=1 Tax=Asticcacaulis sp. EMRT-3 TaxID=3040349 RepID=UPI0024AEA617|nr:FKBP-type peptidyl-prolyl cis-trans isomerase [Asticcacaulis sp. EMRT-3]MDI7775583.1 FKBP-type peptidyl-prolyl cis-trans isomerase [Asticcacaulis sp. EMRT-3]